jgi:Fic family protein
MLPAVAQAAIAHAQFETIHPFADGNGRVGRALIHMVLRRRGLTARVTPPVSLILATRSEEYIRALSSTRYPPDASTEVAAQSISKWVELFAVSCVRAVRDAETFEQRIAQLTADWQQRLGPLRPHATARAIINVLPGAPILTVKTAAALTRRSIVAVNAAAAKLEEAGILRETSRRPWGRIFEAWEIIDAFTDLERRLASPTGETRVDPPVRPVPRRVQTDGQRKRSLKSNPPRSS